MSYSPLLAIKKQYLFLTLVDRHTRCLLDWAVVWEHTLEAIQQMVDAAPKAKWYYSDGFDTYQWLWYHFGRYEISKGKARKSRCFSRCPYALECVLRLFVFAFNRR